MSFLKAMLFATRNPVEYGSNQEAISKTMLFAMRTQASKPISGLRQNATWKAILFAMHNPSDYGPSQDAISNAMLAEW